MNMTFLQREKFILDNIELSNEFYDKAINIACHSKNRSPIIAIILKTTTEVWSNHLANDFILKAFGHPNFAHLKEGKLDLRAKTYIFHAYVSWVNGYNHWCIDPKSHSFMIKKIVKFNI